MKTNVVKSLMLVVVFFSSVVVFGGNRSKMFHGFSHTHKGNYTLEKLNNQVNFNNKTLETWMVTYAFDAAPILIGIEKQNGKRIFHVKSSNLEVDYVTDVTGFGLRLPQGEWTITAPEVVSASVSSHALENQQKITHQRHSNSYLMQLIACYLPQVRN